ncbi:hypothetical protein SAMN04490200_2995 [Pseudomonas proteolytica]|nr:hypothetical protein SAMN04490200_2995 [Pseudomonas proteolytica]
MGRSVAMTTEVEVIVASGLVVAGGLVVASGLAPRWTAKQAQ